MLIASIRTSPSKAWLAMSGGATIAKPPSSAAGDGREGRRRLGAQRPPHRALGGLLARALSHCGTGPRWPRRHGVCEDAWTGVRGPRSPSWRRPQKRGRRNGLGGAAGSACGNQNCFPSDQPSRCQSWPQTHVQRDTITPSFRFVSCVSGLRLRRSAIRGGSSVGWASIVLHSSHVTASPEGTVRGDVRQ
jgi:hypothetical protein